MTGTQRILIKKGDDVATVVEHLIDAESSEVILEMPVGTLFGQNTTNFKLLKREAALLNKEVVIESPDSQIRERAAKAGLGIGESLATIESIQEPQGKTKAKRPRSVRVTVVPESSDAPARQSTKSRRVAKEVAAEEEESTQKFMNKRGGEDDEDGDSKTGREPVRPKKRTSSINWRFLSIAGAIAGVVIIYVALAILPTASIVVTAQKKSWNFDGQIVVDKGLSRIDPVGSRVPGQVFVVKDSVTKRVLATGKQYVSKKASGTITIFNAYSSQPQNIVANTRFVTPSGIVFRITSGLVIPGAKIENGRIIPSSIDTQVVADKPGEQGNVGPTSKLTIPGFAKTPKFAGFYGTLKEGTNGGFVGNTSVPVEKDLIAAKAEGFALVSEQLQEKQKGAVSEGFIVLPGASAITLIKQTVESTADTNNTVGVTTEAQYSVLAFREEDVKMLLQSKVRAVAGQEFEVKTEALSYSALNPKMVALSGGRMSVPTKYDVELWHKIDVDGFKKSVANQPEQKLGEIILSIEGVSGSSAELWPFYVRTVPSNLEKIELVIN
jgi:hypothetical protein